MGVDSIGQGEYSFPPFLHLEELENIAVKETRPQRSGEVDPKRDAIIMGSWETRLT